MEIQGAPTGLTAFGNNNHESFDRGLEADCLGEESRGHDAARRRAVAEGEGYPEAGFSQHSTELHFIYRVEC